MMLTWCFYWTKLQKLKAIHNKRVLFTSKVGGAFIEQNYKNWKQFTTVYDGITNRLLVLLLNKITKIESNSQLSYYGSIITLWCFYWTKLQKLKAIHNIMLTQTKSIKGAFIEQNYKNWKQFTTIAQQHPQSPLVLLLNKITKIESNSQQLLTTSVTE